MKRLLCIFSLLVCCVCIEANGTVSLQGMWRFQLDTGNKGIAGRWFAQVLTDSIALPCTTEEARKGNFNRKSEVKRLTRNHLYNGRAWYQRDIVIPQTWQGQRIVFSMERTKTTTVWVDTICLGKQNSLTTAHEYIFPSELAPGKHRLTVLVDNKDLPPVGDPHQLSDQTQTNWNGILGRIELRQTGQLYVSGTRIEPDVTRGTARLLLRFASDAAIPVCGTLSVEVFPYDEAGRQHTEPVALQTFDCAGDTGKWLSFDVKIPNAKLWSEFHPDLYIIKYRLSAPLSLRRGAKSAGSEAVEGELTFGMREFTTVGTQFAINGKTTFLRGKHDACVFPLTGYAPMTVGEWERVLRIAKSYGINHYRFHTWCPPEAAFEAADRVGIYMQPELPVWGSIGAKAKKEKGDVEQKLDNDPVQSRTDYLREEGLRILKAYGHHPSFVMFALGNEMSGSAEVMADLIATFRQYDSTKLYAQGSNNFLNNPRLVDGDDYWTTTMTGGNYHAGHYEADTDGKEVRGSYPVHTKGHVNNEDCGTMKDYTSAIIGITVPVIGHEIGQYQVYPDYEETRKYTGVVRAANLERFRKSLEQHGMSAQDKTFMQASGALAVACYREDIETALRTPGFGGFQLLDLQDFPGQGTALVGILDAFMDSKGLVSPEAWRRFCSEVVPLARMEKRIWTADETFTATLQVANYSENELDVPVQWSLSALSEGTLPAKPVAQGTVTTLGTIDIPLHFVKENRQLTLKVRVGQYENDYPVWVFVREQPVKAKGVVIARTFDKKTLRALEKGKTVLLQADTTILRQHIGGAFQTDFWCYPMFRRYGPPGTMGLLVNSASAALRGFPSASHSDWQWWNIARYSPVMVLDPIPQVQPVVQVIDNLSRNHRLGILFEANVGKGRLVVTTIGFGTPRPEIQALYHSLLRYMQGKDFRPGVTLTPDEITKLFK